MDVRRTVRRTSGMGIGLIVLTAILVAFGARSRGADLGAVEKPAAERSAAEKPSATYVGSDACQACHAEVAQKWAVSGHGKALSDPSLPQEARGCEACHGPGSEHAGSMGKKPIGEKLSGAPAEQVEQTCGKCHLPEKGSAAAPTAHALNAKYWRRTLHAQQNVSCLSCHQAHGGADHSLQQPASQLCLKCHDALVGKSGEYTHQPIAKGQCLLCHDPHGGAARHNLIDKVSDACRACHKTDSPQFSTAHRGYPVETSDCLSCHDPHASDRGAKLLGKYQHQPFAGRQCQLCHRAGSAELVKPEKDLCVTCHPAATIMPTSSPDGQPMLVHPPVEQGLCTRCHNPHATTRPRQMRDRMDYVCFFCHGGTEDATLSQYQHKPVTTGDCSLCHRGHTSPEKHLLNKESIALCNGCHTTQGQFSHPVGVWKGKPIRDPNTKQTVTCARCHAVHGSHLVALLPEDEDTLCRGCHKK